MSAITSPTLKFFADYVEKETGIMYSEDNAYQLESRLNEICKAVDVPNITDLYTKAQKEGVIGAFKQLLLDIATNNETSFFRDPKMFKAFEHHIVAALLTRTPRPVTVRIWSVASSFGQEAYSIAMILQQMEDAKVQLPNFEILTTDISTRALARVKEAKYSQLEVQRGLPAQLLIKFFEKVDGDQWQLKPHIRLRVKSAKVNLLKITDVSGKFDVIFCRNVLIYQTNERKKAIIQELTNYISTGGYLILGAAEGLIGLSSDFEQIASEGAVFYRKK